MNLGLRAILLLAAVLLFVISIFVDNPSDWWSLGLAAFAASFVVGDLPLGGRVRASLPSAGSGGDG